MDNTTLSKNDNIKIGNAVFHIQTEFYKTSGEVVTLIFRNGEVVKRIENVPENENPSEAVEKQHLMVINKLLSSIKKESSNAENLKKELLLVEEPVSGNTVDFFKVLVSQIVKREDFLFAKIVDVNGKVVLEIKNKHEEIQEEMVETFIDGFLAEERNFYHMEDEGLFLYGFKLSDGSIVVIGFRKRKVKSELYEIVKRASDSYCLKPSCKRCISILIVEDVLFTRLVMRETFKLISKNLDGLCFKEIDEAESLGDALEFLKKKHYDIVITDINLGDGLGIDVARYIKEHNLNTKVVALTMYPKEYEKYKDLFDEFLAKPITPDELKNKLLYMFRSA
ncbi:response regulator [Desulfurobacterium atlanticum]|uniref:Response regulator receiver domain-containing protein n=1 Tax=Desulfurobacterium atlanticum TaxID=240169 RepID=A0A238Y343_9BACT|nr:response regulator [Desulfurobacterium atlanticum]SNR65547.1 Response regulator receiver domain-containing protein [Desulfurobacterium atlanticum]